MQLFLKKIEQKFNSESILLILLKLKQTFNAFENL